MKKTIITLLALAGVAVAKTVTSKIDSTDTNLMINESFATMPSDATYGSLPTLGDGYAIVDKDHTMWTKNNTFSGVSVASFTLSFDVRSFGTGDLLCVGSGETASDKDKVVLATDSNGKLGLTYYATNPDTIISTGIISGTRTEWTTITLVGETKKLGDAGTASKVVSLYVDGQYVDCLNMTTLSPTAWCKYNIDGFQFAGAFRATGTQPGFTGKAEIDNLLFYSRALSAAEVKAFAVPEPATATLSLLALAGLCARRRRA